jgi:hypothetical protein
MVLSILLEDALALEPAADSAKILLYNILHLPVNSAAVHTLIPVKSGINHPRCPSEPMEIERTTAAAGNYPRRRRMDYDCTSAS